MIYIKYSGALIICVLFFILSTNTKAIENQKTFDINTKDELISQVYSYIFDCLDKRLENFSFVATGNGVSSFKPADFLNNKNVFENKVFEEYCKLATSDYNGIILKGYTITKTAWNNSNDKERSVKLSLSYKISWGEDDAQFDATENYCKETAYQLTKNLNDDYSKVFAIHNFIVENYSYDTKGESQNRDTYHMPYEMMINSTGVCSAYAGMFYKMLSFAGIENRIVLNGAYTFDKKDNQTLHAWNIVKVEQQWFHIDITWDDPVTLPFINASNTKYFLKSDSEIAIDHYWDTSLYPKCQYNYTQFKKLAKPIIATQTFIPKEEYGSGEFDLKDQLTSYVKEGAFKRFYGFISDSGMYIFLAGFAAFFGLIWGFIKKIAD